MPMSAGLTLLRRSWRSKSKLKENRRSCHFGQPHPSPRNMVYSASSYSFVNSQEWTLSRTVPDLKLGVVGSLSSGKSALVHRYLTGSYMQEESPEGGRFKKEVVIDGQSYLLLIRDEGSAPEEQFSNWVDAVIFVFSLENEDSFKSVYNYYAKMAHYRDTAQMPLVLVGTQDNISENNPRVIDESRARRLAHDLKRCGYYETCSTYGLNVERVFRDACQKILHQKCGHSRNTTPTPTTPSHRILYPSDHHSTVNMRPQAPSPTQNHMPRHVSARDVSARSYQMAPPPFAVPAPPPRERVGVSPTTSNQSISSTNNLLIHSTPLNGERLDLEHTTPGSGNRSDPAMERFDNQIPTAPANQGPTPTSTPNAQRKHTGAHRRISNIFRGNHKEEKLNGEISMGSGRDIPVKQGHLYKRSSKSLNKEWKKKYVCLYEDGRLSYHSSLKDYMDNSSGKELYLGLATVKIPGRQRPRGPRSHTQPITVPPQLRENCMPVALQGRANSAEKDDKKVLLTAYEFIQENRGGEPPNVSGTESESQSSNNIPKSTSTGTETPNVKSRKRRGHNRAASDVQDVDESLEFVIVSHDQKQWQLEAQSAEDKDDWVTAIEETIEKCLHRQLSQKCDSARSRTHAERAQVLALKSLPGNDRCADCDAPNPDWAATNLGALICIECSGIHRNLGSHVSRVRSLDLDEWPLECIHIMQSMGNAAVNQIWEYNCRARNKPLPTATREEKELWIKSKYEHQSFLHPLPDRSLSQQLMDAVLSKQLPSLVHVLSVSREEHVNASISSRDKRTPLHLACSGNSPELTQLLLWSGADIFAVDQEGRSSLWYARQGGSRACAEVLVHAGLSPDFGLSECNNENLAPRRAPRLNSAHQNGKLMIQAPEESVI